MRVKRRQYDGRPRYWAYYLTQFALISVQLLMYSMGILPLVFVVVFYTYFFYFNLHKRIFFAMYTATELKAAKYTASELKTANFTAAELKTAKFTLAELKAAKFTVTELKTARFTAAELKAANFTLAELKAANFTFAELKSAILPLAAELKFLESANFTLAKLNTANSTLRTELMAANFTIEKLDTAKSTHWAKLKAANMKLSMDLKATNEKLAKLNAANSTLRAGLKAAKFTAAESTAAKLTAVECMSTTAPTRSVIRVSRSDLARARFNVDERKAHDKAVRSEDVNNVDTFQYAQFLYDEMKSVKSDSNSARVKHLVKLGANGSGYKDPKVRLVSPLFLSLLSLRRPLSLFLSLLFLSLLPSSKDNVLTCPLHAFLLRLLFLLLF